MSGIDDDHGYVPYFVSPLASKTIHAQNNVTAAVVDVLVHVLIWVLALVFEIMVFVEADNLKPADTRTFPFAAASLVTFIIPAGIVITSIVIYNMNDGALSITPRNMFPNIIPVIQGGLISSIMFTLICILYTVGIAGATDTWRDYTITLLVMKIMAAAFINSNVRQSP